MDCVIWTWAFLNCSIYPYKSWKVFNTLYFPIPLIVRDGHFDYEYLMSV